MKFIDEAYITVQSGDGGSGCVSFRREKFIEFGGPDGGDGGDGGDVIFCVAPGKRTLYRFRHNNIIRAGQGANGQGRQKHGKNGSSVKVELPPGTIVSNADTGEVIHDFISIDESFTVAKGGRGGRGNKRFTTSRHQAPKFAQPGEPGETLQLRLELKLLADVGLIGLPNAGKSTLISVISSARPKIGDYPFTTLTPNMGMVAPDYGEPFAVADIPGLVEGASGGTGLGISFLRHIERTGILVHIIDASAVDPEDPLVSCNIINRELAGYSSGLAEKKQVVVLNKLDITGAEENAEIFMKELKKTAKDETVDIFSISAVTHRGTRELVLRLAELTGQKDE